MNDRLKRAKEALRLKKQKNLENMEELNRGRDFYRKQNYALADENKEKETEAGSPIVEVVDDAMDSGNFVFMASAEEQHCFVKNEYHQPQYLCQETFPAGDNPYFVSNERMFGEQQMTMMVTAEQFENPMYCSEIPSDLNYNLMFPSTSNGCAAIVPERSPPVSQLLRRPNIMRKPTTLRRTHRPPPPIASDPSLYPISGGLVVSDVELFQQVDRLQRLVAHKDRVIRDLKRRIVGMEQHNNQLARLIFDRKKQQKVAVDPEGVTPTTTNGRGSAAGSEESKPDVVVKYDDECDDGIIDVSA